MALPSINVLMSRVLGFVYFSKIVFDFGGSAFVTNFFPTSTAALFPTSRAFFAPSLAMLFPLFESGRRDLLCGATRKNSR